jgi:hypothetical protein
MRLKYATVALALAGLIGAGTWARADETPPGGAVLPAIPQGRILIIIPQPGDAASDAAAGVPTPSGRRVIILVPVPEAAEGQDDDATPAAPDASGKQDPPGGRMLILIPRRGPPPVSA